MRNSLFAGRRVAARVVLSQISASVVVAALFLAIGAPAAASAMCGGLAISFGTAVLALRMFADPGVTSAGALKGFLVGMLTRWGAVLCALYLVLARWQLPGMPLIVGMATVLAVHLFALRYFDR